jgi:HK97 family phage portal protein
MMGFLRSVVASRPPDHDDFWFRPVGGVTAAGVPVTTERAMSVSAIWAGIRVLANAVASIPLKVFQLTADGKVVAYRHPLYELLHDQPNAWMTSYEWRFLGMVHLLLRGKFINKVLPGARGFADQLVPLHPDRVSVEQLPSGKLRFRHRKPDGQEEILLQDEVFYVRGMSLDGVNGVSFIEYGRETIGLALAAEAAGARFFTNDSTPGGVIEHPGTLSPEAAQRIEDSYALRNSAAGRGRTVVLDEGMKYTAVSISPKDAQFIETRGLTVTEFARWIGVPPHKIADLSRSTNNNIEHQGMEFVTDAVGPWTVNWAQAIRRDLILATDTYQAEFILAGLLRGDAKTRSEYYSAMINAGVMTRNEARELENLNRLPGLDEPLSPLNMRRESDPAPGKSTPPANGDAADDEEEDAGDEGDDE